MIGADLVKRLLWRNRRTAATSATSLDTPDGRPRAHEPAPAELRPHPWGPAAEAVRHARTLLASEPDADVAFIPLCFPGKTPGVVWPEQPEVITVSGVVVIAALRGRGRTALPSGAWGHRAATAIARMVLQERGLDGTAGYAEVRLAGDTEVLEGAQ